jgi:hypothetical protein
MTAGGKREGAGRKSKWKTGEGTARITTQVPETKVDEIKAKIEKIIKPYERRVKKLDK